MLLRLPQVGVNQDGAVAALGEGDRQDLAKVSLFRSSRAAEASSKVCIGLSTLLKIRLVRRLR